MGYKIGKNSQGKLIIIKETPEEEKARLESVAGKIPVMVPILHNIAANVPAVRKYVEETPEMRNYEKFIPAAQVANFVGKTAKSMLFGDPTETDKKNEINRKIANGEPLTEEERNYSLEKNMMAVVDMATPTTTPSGASGLDDIARAQNIKNAGKDLTAMIQGVRNQANKVGGKVRGIGSDFELDDYDVKPIFLKPDGEVVKLTNTHDEFSGYLDENPSSLRATIVNQKPGNGYEVNVDFNPDIKPTKEQLEFIKNVAKDRDIYYAVGFGNKNPVLDGKGNYKDMMSKIDSFYSGTNKVGGVQPRTPNGRYDFNNKLTDKDILESKLKELTKKEIKFTEDGRFPPMNMKDKKFYDKLMSERSKLLGVRH